MNWLPESWRETFIADSTCAIEHQADLHVHTAASDGFATAEQVLEHVATAGKLRVVAITDHDSMLDPAHARRLQQAFGIDVIVGEEVSTQEGHVLALFIERLLPPGRPAAETIAAVHAQGGLCIAPHPYDWVIPSLGRAGLRTRCMPRAGATDGREWAFDAIETLNASITWPAAITNAMAQRLASDLGLPVVGGSDAHTLTTIGQAYTQFPGRTADDLYRAIINGTVSAGGRSWRPAHFLEFYRLTLRQRRLGGALRFALSNTALWR